MIHLVQIERVVRKTLKIVVANPDPQLAARIARQIVKRKYQIKAIDQQKVIGECASCGAPVLDPDAAIRTAASQMFCGVCFRPGLQ